MKRTIVLLLAAILCLCFAACNKAAGQENGLQLSQMETTQVPPENSTEASEETVENPVPQDIELVGPWHLDSEKNDLAALADSLDLFPGYGEWGASMEIRSNGQMSWYIGAESWHGTYNVEDGVLHAQLVSDLEQSTQSWNFRVTEENGVAELEMDYPGMTIYWAYGDREDIPAMGLPSSVYVDRQGTDEVFSSLSITQSDRGYVVEMEIYRLGYFSGTAVEADGMLVYTDDLTDMKGTIRYDSDHAVFEVTQSTSGLAQVGTTWVFPEVKEEF